MATFTTIAGWGLFFWTLKQANDLTIQNARKKQDSGSNTDSVFGRDPQNYEARQSYAPEAAEANYEDIGYTRDDHLKEQQTLETDFDPMLLANEKGWVMNDAEIVRASDAYRQNAVGTNALDPFLRDARPLRSLHPTTPKFYNLW